MSAQLRGWLSTVVEVGWHAPSDQLGVFIKLLRDEQLFTLLPTSQTSLSVGDGHEEFAAFVRIECPMSVAGPAIMRLKEIADEAFGASTAS